MDRFSKLTRVLLSYAAMTDPVAREVERFSAVNTLVRTLSRLDQSAISEDSLEQLFLEATMSMARADCAVLLGADGGAHNARVRRALGVDVGEVPADLMAVLAPSGHTTDGPLPRLLQCAEVIWTGDRAAGMTVAYGAGAGRLDRRDIEAVETALGIMQGIVERKRAEQRVLHDAFHDTLTGLPNRTLFIEHLDQAIGRAQRANGYLFSVLFIDIDRFKVVNDGLGHDSGDRMLVAVGQRMKRAVRGGDVVARLGGDEFAVLADDLTELGDALRLADRIQEQFAQPFELDGRDVVVSASIGIARNAPQCRTGGQLLRDADIAMYRAKEFGGGQHRLFDSGMHSVMMSRLELESDLRRALAEDQFRVVYQPIVDLRDGALDGFEALLRWQHPERGTILPGEFINIAEETGLVVPIGRWLIREVVAKLAKLNRDRDRPVSVSVNLADREFLSPDLVEDLRQVLDDASLPEGVLHLELTERMLMTHGRDDILPRLKALGVRIAIDDFGTGWSSLSRLHQLPIDALKIDHSFVSELSGQTDSGEIVRTIVSLAHNLGIVVIAEGVERPEQLRMLRDLGCEYAQGFLLSRPLDAAGVAPVLQRSDWLATLQ